METLAERTPESKDSWQQLTLPIDSAPPTVRQHGLQEAHSWPYVSHGKDAAGEFRPVFRRPAALAWAYPELELGRTPNSLPCLLFDLDRAKADWLCDVFAPDMPLPNWATTRRTNGHAHIVYTLARPVLTGAQARPTPQAWLARIGEYLAAKLQADAAYGSALAHNPMSRASRAQYQTEWLRKEPYSLAELSAYIPKGWRRPAKQPRTIYGRNDHLFRAGMKWTGRPAHWGDWEGMAAELAKINAGFVLPLGERELGGIVASVQRYQERQLRSGQTQRTFSFIQAARGKRSGAARRERTAERDAAIVRAIQGGQSMRAVARAYGLSDFAVRHIVKRGVRD